MRSWIERTANAVRSLDWRELVKGALAFSPAILLAILISEHAVNTPVWDDWERAPLIEKAEAGELSFNDIFGPHIENRMVFPAPDDSGVERAE